MRRFFPWATLLLSAGGGVAYASTSEPSGIAEIDLVFPRNEAYAPMGMLPVVFAIQNPELVAPLGLTIQASITNATKHPDAKLWGPEHRYDHEWTMKLDGYNMSGNEPFFASRFLKEFEIEREWKLTWWVEWTTCNISREAEEADGTTTYYAGRFNTVFFNTSASAPEADLAASINDRCPEDDGAVLGNMTVSFSVNGTMPLAEGGTCHVTDDSFAEPSPCRPKADSAVVSSIEARKTEVACLGSDSYKTYSSFVPPLGIECPTKQDNAARQLAAGGIMASFAAVFGALFCLIV